jgi:phenylalanyl-tRNA synthetase beta chain
VLTAVLGAFRTGPDLAAIENDFYYVKGVLEALLQRMGITGYGCIPVQHPAFHPYIAAAVVLNHRPEAAGKKPVQPDEVLGVLGRLDDETLKAFDIGQRTFLLALDFDRLIANAAPVRKYEPLPRFQGVYEDLSFILRQDLPAERLVASMRRSGAPLVEDVRLKDVYQGPGIPEEMRSMTFRLTYRAADRTLSTDEVAALRAKIVQMAERQTGAKLRG